MMLKERFSASRPDAFFLDAADPGALAAFLLERVWIRPSQRIASIERAGEGNMNLVLRVALGDGGSFILKQSRPWAEKFPSVEAPAERADVEAEFYRRTATEPAIAARSPRMLHADSHSHILMLEDLGHGTDLFRLYRRDSTLDADTLMALMDYLAALHRNFRRPGCGFVIENLAMRAFNAEHIFRFPFSSHAGFDLDAVTPGLAAVAATCRDDAALRSRIQMLEGRYLGVGDTLLHGDFFPGSVLLTDSGVRVIDPEFCFFGDAEFDVGVLLAHLTLAAQPKALIGQGLARYTEAVSGSLRFSQALCWQYAGVEILRRLLGLAQLPLTLDLSAKQALVETARAWVLRPETERR